MHACKRQRTVPELPRDIWQKTFDLKLANEKAEQTPYRRLFNACMARIYWMSMPVEYTIYGVRAPFPCMHAERCVEHYYTYEAGFLRRDMVDLIGICNVSPLLRRITFPLPVTFS
jgi:hypothetical protein